jgi:hypothetical protein
MPNTDIYKLKETLSVSIKEAIQNGIPIATIGILLENLLNEANLMTADAIKHEQQVLNNSEE